MLPAAVRAAIEEVLSTTVQHISPLAGGEVNQVVRVECPDGAFVVKWRASAPPGLFTAEANGLRALAATGAIRTPAVLACGDDATPFLALEYLPPVPVGDAPGFTHRFAEQLATLHRVGMENNPLCGWEQDNFLGVFPQANRARIPCWSDFYRDCRLLPQIAMARKQDYLTWDREDLLNEIIESLPALLADLPAETSLLHGDLWAGNFLCTSDDTPALIDPAVYFGPREMEIAYVELFGGFPPDFMDAYRGAWPPDDGYPTRRPLHQLYPLLVHLNYFGEHYGPRLERACRDALSALT